MIYKVVHEYGEFILEVLDESEVFPEGDPLPDDKIVVFLSRKLTETSSSMSQDQPHHPPLDHS